MISLIIDGESKTRFARERRRSYSNIIRRVLLIILTLFVFSAFTPVVSVAILMNNSRVLPALSYCGPNTISKPCGNPCQRTCGQQKPKYCTKGCIVDGCVCSRGYIRRDENGPCIPESWCGLVAEKWNWGGNLRVILRDG